MMTLVRMIILQMRPKFPPFVHQPKSSSSPLLNHVDPACLSLLNNLFNNTKWQYKVTNFITQQDNTIQIQSDCGWRNTTGPRLRPQTAPRRDLKATKDHSHLRPSLPSTTPPHHSVTKMYIFEYIRILSDSSTHSYFIRFKNLNIFIRTLFVSNFRRNNISCFKAAYK